MYHRPCTSAGGGVGLRVLSLDAAKATWLSGEATDGANLLVAAFLRPGALGALRPAAGFFPLHGDALDDDAAEGGEELGDVVG